MTALSAKQIHQYNNDGYLVLDNVVEKSKFEKIRSQFSEMIERDFRKYNSATITFPESTEKKEDYLLNEGMIALENKNHQYLADLYNQLPRTNAYYSIVSDPSLIGVVNRLLGRKEDANLYINSQSVRMDIPGLTPYIYGWHRDDQSTIQKSRFVQMWAPLIGSVGGDLGGLFVLANSHGRGLVTSHSDIEGSLRGQGVPIRARYDASVIGAEQYKELYLELEWGQILFFQGGLMHKSGINHTRSRMRYVLLCFYHDLSNPEWEFFVNDVKSNNSPLTS